MSYWWLTPLNRSQDVITRHLPLGPAWRGFRAYGKRMYRMLTALAGPFEDAWTALAGLVPEMSPYTTSAFLSDWQTACGLPDACLWQADTIEEQRAQIVYRLSKRRWTTAQDWHDLAALFDLIIRITPGWYVQKPALYAFEYPKRYDLFPRLGRFRVYIDIVGIQLGGYVYGYPEPGDGYPIPYGLASTKADQFLCLLERVRPANVVIIYNGNPLLNYCTSDTFTDTFSDTFCGEILED